MCQYREAEERLKAQARHEAAMNAAAEKLRYQASPPSSPPLRTFRIETADEYRDSLGGVYFDAYAPPNLESLVR